MPTFDPHVGDRFDPRPRTGAGKQPCTVTHVDDDARKVTVEHEDGSEARYALSTFKRYFTPASGSVRRPRRAPAKKQASKPKERVTDARHADDKSTYVRPTKRKPDPTAEQLERCPDECRHCGAAMKADPSNVYLHPGGGFGCRVCIRARNRRAVEARKTAA